MADKLTPFDYLLNAFEQARQHADPASQGYADKRAALYQHVRELEEDSTLLAVAQRYYAAVDFDYDQHEDSTFLIIALPDGVRVGRDLRAALRVAAPSTGGE